MKRAKKIILVSHCLLNVNSKVEGLAQSTGTVREIVDALLDRDYAIFQMPCPEHILLGIKRWGQSVSQYNNPFYVNYCKKLSKEIIMEVKDYIDNGYQVKYVIGMDGSPSCGINATSIGDCGGTWKDSSEKPIISVGPGEGVFIRCLKEEANDKEITLDFFGLDESNPTSSLSKLIKILD